MNPTTLSTGELIPHIGNPDTVILDARPVAAFNGWKMQGEVRGGHLPGAIPLPLSWLSSLSPAEQSDFLVDRGITAANHIVIYGYSSADSEAMAGLLKELGFEQIFVYESGLVEWATDPELPLERLPNYHLLFHPSWLEQLISGRQPEASPAGDWLLFEVAGQGQQAYESGHIPGALYLETTTLEEAPLWNVVDGAVLIERLLALGVSPEKTILLYGRDPMAAARAALILMYAGVRDVRLLDGGYAAWIGAGFPLERDANKPHPARRFGQDDRPVTPGRPEIIIDTARLMTHLASESAVLVSVRSWAEYTGQSSGYSFIQAKGRIAGAVWGRAGSVPHHMQAYRNGDNTMRNYHEIAAFWRAVGITPDKSVVFSCGTGWRAAEAYFYAHLMGWSRIAVYDGGWLEWSSEGGNPFEIGEPE